MIGRVAATDRREPRFPGVDRSGHVGGGAKRAPCSSDPIDDAACRGVERVTRCAAAVVAEVGRLPDHPRSHGNLLREDLEDQAALAA